MVGKKRVASSDTATMVDFPRPVAARLPRGPHTAQLLFHLSVHATLFLLASIILPAHLLSRKAEETSNLGLLHSVVHLFSLPATLDNIKTLRKTMWGVVQAVILIQAWALIRFKKWFDLGVAIEHGDAKAAEEATKRGWAKGAELMTLTSVSVPVALIIFHALTVLLGARLLSDATSTLCLSLALSLTLAFPILHVAPALSSTPLFTSPSQRTKALYRLLWTTLLIPLLSAFVGAAPLTFDHGKAWQVWPVPPLLGLLVGVAVGDVIGGLGYVLASAKE